MYQAGRCRLSSDERGAPGYGEAGSGHGLLPVWFVWHLDTEPGSEVRRFVMLAVSFVDEGKHGD
jgi:hypothetical protein